MTAATSFDFRTLPLRDGLARERERAWQRLAAPGTWWSGAERLAIAAEARLAHACSLCQVRKEALSPYTVAGDHDNLGLLAAPVIEVVHRVATDAGRLTERGYESMRAAGITDEHYIESIGVVALITALDTFDLALGLPQRPVNRVADGQRVRCAIWPGCRQCRPKHCARVMSTRTPYTARRIFTAHSAWCRWKCSISSTWTSSCT
jgi:hypothetical protein